MKNVLFIIVIILSSACSDGSDDSVIYDITYTVTASDGTTINKVQYKDSDGDLQVLNNVNSPWSINIKVRGGLALEAAAFDNILYQENLKITAIWTPDGGTSQNETETLPNDTPNSVIDNGKVEISGRTLPK